MKSAILISSGGCDSFLTDFDLMKKYLENNSYVLSKNIEKTDIIIVHTCAVTKEMEGKSLKLVAGAMQKQKKAAKLIVTGCLPSINKTACSRLFDGAKVSANALEELDKIITPRIKLRDIKYIGSPRYLRKNNEIDYALRIGWGCLGKCSYCAVKSVFEKIKSKPALDILQEFNNAYAHGYRNFSLIAHDTGIYGKDCNTSLVDLLQMLSNKHADCRFQLFNITPNRLKQLLIPLEKFIRLGMISKIVLPVQSGSNRILRLMKRGYTVEEFKYCVKKINEYSADLSIKTDVMVGFPSETRQDFSDTANLVEWLSGYKVIVQGFVYSKRPNTEANKMLGQINQRTKNDRLKQLNRLYDISFMFQNKKLFRKTWRKKYSQ